MKTHTIFDLLSARCDHCGKFARRGGGLFTLHEMANGHPHEEDCAICGKCSDEEHTPEYWFQWLEKRYPSVVHSHTACPDCGWTLHKREGDTFWCDTCNREWTQVAIENATK